MQDDDIASISPTRIAAWEKCGYEAIKADLINGNFRLVGGPPEVREQAWRWVRFKERDSEMAKRDTQRPPPAKMSAAQKRRALEIFGKRLAELERFDLAAVRGAGDPGIRTLEVGLDKALTDAFGTGSAEYERFRHMTRLFQADRAYVGTPPASWYQEGYGKGIAGAIAMVRAIINGLTEDLQYSDGCDAPLDPEVSKAPANLDVFIVHGRDDGLKSEVARFVERLGLKAVILHEQANEGRTLIEKFEAHSNVAFAVVLLTPDDVGGLAAEKPVLSPRARQNVVMELGFFFAKLGRARVCGLLRDHIEKPSDVDGVAYIPYDASGAWKFLIVKEMKAAGLPVSADNIV